MIIKYAPNGGTERTWSFKPAELTSAEAEALEDVTDLTLEEFEQHLMKGRIRCKRAVLWLFLRREHPQLRFTEVEFKVAELTTAFDREEKTRLLEALDAAGLSGPQRELAEKLLTDDDPTEEPPATAPKKAAGASAG
ncbi:hypothetical protein [Microtetraspora malaysiensis]|uniref:hypothetical protein n=1 Tax=Microtetraspora malaysiensis TaxID=161358 RepID=UPI003D8CA025